MLLVSVMFICFYSSPGAAQNYLGGIRVQVKDFYSKAPLSGASILITPNNYTATTDAQGEALIEHITPFRNYQIRAEYDGYIAGEIGFVSVYADEETQSIIPLKKKASISGTVQGQGQYLKFLRWPLKDAAVILGRIENVGGTDAFVGLQAVRTDARGRFTFDTVDENSYKIVALKDGFLRNDIIDIPVVAGEDKAQDFAIERRFSSQGQAPTVAITTATGNPKEGPYTAPARLYFTAQNVAGITEFYWIKEKQPEGAAALGQEYYIGNPPGSVYTFILPSLGTYTVSLFTADSAGIARKASVSFATENVAPEAVPSVIPGPVELPLIDAGALYTTSNGSSSVTAGSTVYLRGFAIDMNLLSPEEFNPDAPTFDIYGNKNGNFKASLFKFAWTLKDESDDDVSSALTPSPQTENVSFTIPGDADPGNTYTATLTVTDDKGALSQPQSLTITIAQKAEETTCAGCHADKASGYALTAHAKSAAGAKCQDCHGAGSVHAAQGGQPKLSVNYWSGVCGQCHEQFSEIQKAMHSNALPFGYYEPTDGRLTSCYRCHYTKGYIGATSSGTPFREFRYGPNDLPTIPQDTPNVSCSVCHDSHNAKDGNPFSLRTGSAGTACDTCHYEKWQNAILEGMAGEVGNGYHYPGQDYSPYAGDKNPHRTEDKCVMCHMSTSLADKDIQMVRKVGGHTLRMRDFGDDQIPGTADDTLNIPVCQGCHKGLSTFDRNGVQTQVIALLTELSNVLKGDNHEFLPPNQPGKCARCHKGGTVPFLNDPDKVLENAYTNYKLFINDRSYGVHNPGYTKKLLQDSIDSVKQLDSK